MTKVVDWHDLKDVSISLSIFYTTSPKKRLNFAVVKVGNTFVEELYKRLMVKS